VEAPAEIVAGEHTLVYRPGGRIALASWTPFGFLGDLFRVPGGHVPPPTGLRSPLLFGAETSVREWLGNDCSEIETARVLVPLEFPSLITHLSHETPQ
jgi:hypothetical protein